MTRRKIENRNTRKIFKSGESYAVTLPVEIIRDLGWREKQKITVKKKGKKIIIEDWKNK